MNNMERAELVERYTPNTNIEDMTFVQLDFMCWDYKLSYNVQMENNLRGLSVAQEALDQICEQLYDEDTDSLKSIIMKNDDGDTLEYEFEDECELEDMLVGYTIWKLNAVDKD